MQPSTEMKYRCLVFDHDDTTVNSTATIHHPCFVRFLEEYYPGRRCSLEEYFIKNFSPGFLPMCREEYGMDDRMLEIETQYWQDYVRSRIPDAYPGIRAIMQRQKEQGGYTAVISHSFRENILRDYAQNGLPEPGDPHRPGRIRARSPAFCRPSRIPPGTSAESPGKSF